MLSVSASPKFATNATLKCVKDSPQNSFVREECAYWHPQDKNYEAQKLSAKHEIEISNLKAEVQELKLEVKQLTVLTMQFFS